MNRYLQAYEKHKQAAGEAFRLYVGLCGGKAPPRVPGMDTAIRLACRIDAGRTIEQAAAAEYVYRWHLAILPSDQVLNTILLDPCVSIFGAPHTIGM